MNLNRIISMVVRIIFAQVLRKGIRSGANMFANRGSKNDNHRFEDQGEIQIDQTSNAPAPKIDRKKMRAVRR